MNHRNSILGIRTNAVSSMLGSRDGSGITIYWAAVADGSSTFGTNRKGPCADVLKNVLMDSIVGFVVWNYERCPL